MAPLLIALVLIGGGTSLAARSALPGSALYPVKVDINDKLQSSLELSSEGKADWDATLESRRLSEAETLDAEGKLDANTEADLKTRFNASAQDYATQMAAVNATGKGSAKAVSTASNLQGSLAAHAQVLAGMNNSLTADLLSSVTAESVTVAQGQNTLEAAYSADTAANTASSAKASETAAQGSISAAQSLVTSANANGSSGAAASANANIAVASDAYQQGMNSYNAGNYGDAFIQFQNAMRIANQTKTALSIGQTLSMTASSAGSARSASSASSTTGSGSSASSSAGSTSSSASGSLDTSIGASGSLSAGQASTGGNAGVNVNLGQ